VSRATHPAVPNSGLPGKIADYRVDRCVGQGRTAAVYLAQDEHLCRPVALKVLAPELGRDAAFSDQVIHESRAVAAVHHPHVLPVYDAGQVNGTLYVAMRYAEGGSAQSLPGRPAPLPFGYAWHIIAQIASALDAAHAQGLIHRDVRLANILLEAGDSSGEHAYLSDFGWSKHVSPEHIIATGQYAGTLDYAAPEQIEGRALNGRADLYSLACAGFELLCGMPPFGHDQGLTVMYAHLYAPPPRAAKRRADLPAAADRVLATALAKDPAERYPSCGEFADELRSALGLRPQQGKQPAAGPGPRDPDPLGKPTSPEAVTQPIGPDLEPPARHRNLLKLILIALAVIVIAAPVALGMALSKRLNSPAASAPPARSPSASGQAAAVSTLLASSAATRTALHNAVRQVGACTNLSGAVSQLQNVVHRRLTESRQASTLHTAALPNGAALKSDLIAALNTSLGSDRDYLTWAQQRQERGCTPADQSTAYSAAVSASQRADVAKQTLVQVWNPIAARYGIEQISVRNF
jgi:serine/threonine protein kinase